MTACNAVRPYNFDAAGIRIVVDLPFPLPGPSRPLVKLLEHLRTFLEMRNRFPTVMLVPIPFPLDQVLYPPSSSS